MNLITSLENEFEQIIEYFKAKGEMHSIAEANIRSFIEYLLEQTSYTKKRLSEIILDLNYETIERDEEFKVWPEIEFWRGVDDYGTSVMLNYDGGVADVEDQESIVKGRYDNDTIPPDSIRLQQSKKRQAIKVDITEYPISLLGFYEYRFDETALYYAWIAYIWQEVEGHRCGVKVRTVQNNSIAMFSLNDFLRGDFSEYMEADYGDKPEKLSNPFPRKFTLIELFLRASQSSYPFNPFNTYWRYFEKGDQFQEIGTYEFKTGIRNGLVSNNEDSELMNITNHVGSKNALLYIRDFTNRMINEGWREKLRPLNLPSKFDEKAFPFGYWTGVNWTNDQSTKLTEQVVIDLEEILGVKFPISYFNYLRITNGRQHNSRKMFFPINDLYTVRMMKFYTIEELLEFNNVQTIKESEILIIGEAINSDKIGINVNKKSKSYGKVQKIKDGRIIECDYFFEKFARYAQSSPKQPEIYAAEENDAEFLKKRLEEGWDYNTVYQYQNALSQAASHNSYEALKELLKAGARLKYKTYREHMKSAYDERTMSILDEYHEQE